MTLETAQPQATCTMRPVLTIAALVALALTSGMCAQQQQDLVETDDTSTVAPTISEIEADASAVTAQEVIGEWQDYLGDFWDNNLRIVRENGEFRLMVRGKDGSTTTFELAELQPQASEQRRFEDVESGEIYAMQSETGELALYDADGFKRTAPKVR